MNERIRQIAMQAKLGPALLLHHWGTVDALTDSEQAGLQQLEKFAEMIVEECCQKLEDDGMVEVAIEMKQHFGVDE